MRNLIFQTHLKYLILNYLYCLKARNNSNFHNQKDTMQSKVHVSQEAKLLEPLMYDGGGTDTNTSNAESEHTKDKSLQKNTWAYHKAQLDKNAKIANLNVEGFFYLDDRKGIELSASSLFCFKNTSWLRFNLVWIIHQAWFNNFILFVIFINSVMMGMKDYTDFESTTQRNKTLERFEPFINTIIYVECVIKVIAMGFLFGENSYLKDGWNVLDFIVVLASVVVTFAKTMNEGHVPAKGIQAFRAFRLLRPLRLIGRIQTLKGMVSTLINSIAALQATFGLMCFVFLVYAIFGMTVWSGALHYRCYATEHPENGAWVLYGAPDDTYTDVCSDSSPCPDGAFCGNRFLEKDPNNPDLPYPFTDSDNLWVDSLMEEQHWGYNNFDNFGSAMLTVFQVTTTDGWTPMMFMYEKAGSQILSWFFFITCVIVCNFFIMNLTVGQMLLVYEDQIKDEEQNQTELDPFQKELQDYAQTKVPKEFAQGKRNIINYIMSVEDIQISKSCMANSELKIKKTLFQSFAEAQKQNVNRDLDGPDYYQGKVVSTCLDIVEDVKFNAFILLIIIANTIVLCCDKYPNYPDDILQIFMVLNWFFTLVFTVELIIKVIALGVRPFLKDYFNIFDALIVVSAIQGIYLSDIKGENGSKQLLILRTFRCFRILKLFKVGDLKVLVDSQLRTIPVFLPFLALIIFIFYIFALIGMSFFAGQIKIDENGNLSDDDADRVREGYDDLGMAMGTIFQVLMGAEWRFIWYQNMTASGPYAAFYYVAIHLVLGTVMINLLMAIMLGNYDKARKFADKRKIFDAIYVLAKGTDQTGNVDLFKDDLMEEEKMKKTMSVIVDIVLEEEYASKIKNNIINKKDESHEDQVMNKFQKKMTRRLSTSEPKYQEQDLSLDEYDPGHFANSSLGIFHIDGKIRQWCLCLCVDRANHEELQEIRYKINSKETNKDPLLTKPQGQTTNYNSQFEQVVLLLIIINSIQLAFNKGPLTDEHSAQFQFFKTTNIVFTVLFATEMFIKIIGLGFYKNQMFHIDAYILSGWNQVDFIIVTSSLIDIMVQIAIALQWTTSTGSFGALKPLRALRALRPLRAIQRYPALKQVVTAFLDSFVAVQNVFLVYILLLLIFGVIGVSLMKGQFGACDDESISTEAECPEGQWSVNDSNFDNIIQAIRTLCIMTTTEGWSGVMYLGVDSAGEGNVGKQNNSPFMIWYFVAFMTTGSLFIANLLVGVVIDQYNKAKAQREQQETNQDVKIKVTLAFNEMIAQKNKQQKSVKPDNWRISFYNLSHHPFFDRFIIMVVLANTVTMAMNSYQSKLEDTLKLCNLIFTIIFNLEMVIKLIAELDRYFASSWNRLDFFIVISADLGIILDLFGNKTSKMVKEAITVFRVLRILRVAKLLQRFHNIQILLNSLFQIAQGINNVLLLLALVIYIYALLGINMFAGAMQLAELDQYNNFDSFGRAVLSLVRYSTGEDFQEFMYEYTNSGNGCLHDGEGDDKFNYATYVRDGNVRCGTNLAIPFFFSFTVITAWMVINLIIAAIIDGLASASLDREKLINNEVIEQFLEIWTKYDPNLTWELDVKSMSNKNSDSKKARKYSVWNFLAELPDPLNEPSKESTLKLEWDGSDDQYSEKFIFHFDDEYSQHFKIKKLQILKFISKMEIKFHKRDNGDLFVKFDEIAYAWIQRNLTLHNEIQKKLSETTTKKLSTYEENQRRSAKLAKNSNLQNFLLSAIPRVSNSKLDPKICPRHLLASEMIADNYKDFKKKKEQKAAINN